MSSLWMTWRLLTSGQRRGATVLALLMLIGMLLETLGVGIVIPALALMTQADLATRYPAISPWLHALGDPTPVQLILVGLLILALVYVLKTLFLLFLTWRQMTFAFDVQADLSLRLFAGYLRQPYTFHLQRNSAQLIRNAVQEVDVFTKLGLTAGLQLLTDLLIVVGISFLLLAVEPLGALAVVLILAAAGGAFHKVAHSRILRWGETRQLNEGLRLQDLQQGLGGAKEAKLLGREDMFLGEYRRHSLASTRAARKQSFMQQTPRLVLELLAVIGLVALAIIMIMRGKPLDTLIPTIGLFAAAAFRMMPSATRIMSSIQNVRYARPVIQLLHQEMSAMRAAALQPASTGAQPFDTLELDNVTFRYPTAESDSLRAVSLRVQRGESIGIIGGSGAGKSTLLDVMLGLLPPTQGSVRFNGNDIRERERSWQEQIGYVPQSVFLMDDSLRRNVGFGLTDAQIDEQAVWRAVRAAQLEEYVQGLREGLDTRVGERGVRLSGGQLQRIGIARALYHDPAVLVLDEATSALDTAIESSVMDAVRALHGRKTVIIVAHRVSTVEHCDRLVQLERGRIVAQDVPARILAGVQQRA